MCVNKGYINVLFMVDTGIYYKNRPPGRFVDQLVENLSNIVIVKENYSKKAWKSLPYWLRTLHYKSGMCC